MPDQQISQPPDLLTLTEAAALLRAPVATLRYWRHLGTGPHSLKIGRHVLYRRDDLHAWIDAQHDDAHGPTSRSDQTLSRLQPDSDQPHASQPTPTVGTTTSRR
jgi:excisionase family DNA binding protein